ncbi:hypothetical protein GF402_01535 [Candidatus Fermentibacteria bacterium]|nr:hypothetical protein [Candidatus Fermentibacteria bacterium]
MSIALSFLITAILATGQQPPSVIEIIEEEGQFAFTDGSSTYLFLQDGSFFLEPTTLSGRSIEGQWKSIGTGWMEITGTWGWYNGISSANDYRRMVLYINVRSTETENSELLWRSENHRMYDVYCIVDELAKLEANG